MLKKKRCPWLNLSNRLYVKYHDQEWGRPVHCDRTHFEFLLLEGAQAGLSWETILKKRENYRKAFAGFDPQKVARFNSADKRALFQNDGIVRNRLKIDSAIQNARAFLKVQQEFGSFDRYLWAYVGGKPIINSFRSLKDYPSKTNLSDQISEDLKQRGFKFVGSTIIYAYLQAMGLVQDHSVDCFLHKKKFRH